MGEKTSSRNMSIIVFITSFLIYSVITMSRNAFAASIASVIDEGLLPHTAAGVINAGFYLFNGIGQVASWRALFVASAVIVALCVVLWMFITGKKKVILSRINEENCQNEI